MHKGHNSKIISLVPLESSFERGLFRMTKVGAFDNKNEFCY